MAPDTLRLHGTAVAFDGKGVLIIGASGRGKSSLALQLMAFGCQLVSDDQTVLTRRGDDLWASAPETIRGLIEARGVGVLRAEAVEAAIGLIMDLDQTEPHRLPRRHEVDYLGLTRPCLHHVDAVAWPAAIVQYLKAGREEPQ